MNRDTHHCPGASGRVDAARGNCRRSNWPGIHCDTHQWFCMPHNIAVMKGKNCKACDAKARFGSRDKHHKAGDSDETKDGTGGGGTKSRPHSAKKKFADKVDTKTPKRKTGKGGKKATKTTKASSVATSGTRMGTRAGILRRQDRVAIAKSSASVAGASAALQKMTV